MRKGAASLVLAYALAALIQGVLLSRITPNFVPDLCLIVVVFMGLKLPMPKGILISATFGLVSDILFTQSIGLNLGAYPLAFVFTKIISALFFADSAPSRVLLVILSGLCIKLYYAFVLRIVGLDCDASIYPLAIILSGALAPFLISKLETWTIRNEA